MLAHFNFRSNGIGFLRLLFAAVVVYAHAYPLGGYGDEWFYRWSGHSQTLGHIAVGGFFVLSGFLITRSYERTSNLCRFLWHRVLRIFPAFWVCLAFTASVFAPIAMMREPGVWWPSAGYYIASNALLKTGQLTIGGLFTSVPFPGVFNGSIWTLQYEFLCYVAVAAIGLAGFINRKPLIVPAFAAVLYFLCASAAWRVGQNINGSTLQIVEMLAYFAFGSTAYLLRERIPMKPWITVICICAAVISVPTRWHAWVLLPCVSYLVLYAAMVLPIRGFDRKVDLSYGLYIYAFPCEQLLALFGVAAIGVAGFTASALIFALSLAACSWFVIERPALSLKNAPSLLAKRQRSQKLVAREDAVAGVLSEGTLR